MIKANKGNATLKGSIPCLCTELTVAIKAVHSAIAQNFTAEIADTLTRVAIANGLDDMSLMPEDFKKFQSMMEAANAE